MEMTVTVASRGPARLPQTARQERYGLAYLSDVCADAGVGVVETRPGEDHYAIDAYVVLPIGLVPVQVKCTTKKFTVRDPKHINWPIEKPWWDKWCENTAPVFILLVHVPEDETTWIDFGSDDLTTHHTAAYWVEVDKTSDSVPTSIDLARSQRFTKDTIQEWQVIYERGIGRP
ncbi:hypothetical protein GCM10027404_09700 [Arthrobacter tumbae]|uniref:DUF4365 domain-containing protein n=1 Tax=Arthrobacter tumbae TaxID=163874 RepID=UPI00195B1317|nr:DUF4365 domain-containing protein [Arthrobacter tumbae]MBM7782252.1 hypothetical protein [Arthrobacter tumbae]